jgi:glutamate formiminotransferase
MNLSNPDETDIHVAYEAVLALARALGARVNGSEIVGLVPLQSMAQGRSLVSWRRCIGGDSSGASDTRFGTQHS